MEIHRRYIEDIIDDICMLTNSPDLESDPLGAEKFRALYTEYMEAHGIRALTTKCTKCGYTFNDDTGETWGLNVIENKLVIIEYTCPLCGTITPQSLQHAGARTTRINNN